MSIRTRSSTANRLISGESRGWLLFVTVQPTARPARGHGRRLRCDARHLRASSAPSFVPTHSGRNTRRTPSTRDFLFHPVQHASSTVGAYRRVVLFERNHWSPGRLRSLMRTPKSRCPHSTALMITSSAPSVPGLTVSGQQLEHQVRSGAHPPSLIVRGVHRCTLAVLNICPDLPALLHGRPLIARWWTR